MTRKFLDAEAITAQLALVGVAVEPASAAGIAETLSTQVTSANKAFAALAFEIEPATYLKVAAEEVR
jgi:hypothetical protein